MENLQKFAEMFAIIFNEILRKQVAHYIRLADIRAAFYLWNCLPKSLRLMRDWNVMG